jgi:serine/threonine-protein kinase
MASRPVRSGCNESRLKSFLDEELPEPENVQLAAHLDHCAACRRALERLAAESRLWGELRQLATAPGPLAPPAGQETEPFGTSPPGGPPAEADISLDSRR